MDLSNKHFCFVSQFAADYAGNFILMLNSLAESLVQKYDAEVFFIFPKQKESPWLKELSGKYEIAFVNAFSQESHLQIKELFDKWKIDIVHTHFEAFDIPVSKAAAKSERDIRQVWHLHDYVDLTKQGRGKWLKRIKTSYKYWVHYKYYGNKAYLIGVSPEVLYTIEQFKKSLFIYPKAASTAELENMSFKSGEAVLNGIDFSRINGRYSRPAGEFVFLSFASLITWKGIPTLLSAAEMLKTEGYHFEVHLTRGAYLDKYLKNRYPDGYPQWLSVIDQTDNIASIFDSSSCYVSASIAETMSMAIAEASIYGLPVIQSDIPGTWWNAGNPSAFIFEKGNVKALCQKMKELIDMNPQELESRCRITSSNNRGRLSLQDWCQKMTDIYEKKLD